MNQKLVEGHSEQERAQKSQTQRTTVVAGLSLWSLRLFVAKEFNKLAIQDTRALSSLDIGLKRKACDQKCFSVITRFALSDFPTLSH